MVDSQGQPDVLSCGICDCSKSRLPSGALVCPACDLIIVKANT